MYNNTAWLFIFVGLYAVVCLFFGFRALRRSQSSEEFFVASRSLPTWVFVLAATSASYAGWAFIGQAGLVFRDGFQYANAAMFAIGVPLAGILVLKRQWMLGRRFGHMTQGEMFAGYFQSDAIRIVSVSVSLLFAVPLMGILLGASGYMISEMTGGALSRDFAMWLISSIVVLYVVTGGMPAVANIGTVQCGLFATGVIILGVFAYEQVGGFDQLNQALAGFAATPTDPWGSTKGLGGGDYSGFFAHSGVIQWVDGLGKESPVGGPWTAVMCLSYLMALMGIQASPAFSIWGHASRSPRAFGIHQVWISGLCVGIIFLFFLNFQGLAARFLGADAGVNASELGISGLLPELGDGQHAALVAHYIGVISEIAPWLAGFLAVCAVAAIQSVVAAFMLGTSVVLSRDIYKRYIRPDADDVTMLLAGRICVALLFGASLLMATFATEMTGVLAGLALGCAFQLVPALVAVLWMPWITRQAAILGLAAGLVAVVLTESLGQMVTGGQLPWGRWPWTIHSAAWGMFFNLLICLIVSALTNDDPQRSHRMTYHAFLREYAPRPKQSRWLTPLAWVVTLVWMFFAVGPGAVIGNDLFGAPNAGYEGWYFRMPSIWVWQIGWWALGVGVIWLLAYRLEMSTEPTREITADGAALRRG